MRKLLLIIPVILATSPALAFNARKEGLVEPKLYLASQHTPPTVALTFDACMGATDQRILTALIDNHIRATFFVTARWIRRNQAALDVMKAHPDLFEIENHGAMHVPAVDKPIKIYGIRAAGSADAVRREVAGGAAAIVAQGLPKPKWFRGATAIYSASAMAQIRAMGFRIAGFSVNGDGGSLLGVGATERSFARARDGDVIIAHINQPTHQAGKGVVEAIAALQKRGYHFVRLMDRQEVDTRPLAAGG